jgi:hypothetical protein
MEKQMKALLIGVIAILLIGCDAQQSDKMGFDNVTDYRAAKKLGIEKSSKYYTYLEKQRAKKEGYPDYKSFVEAKRTGYPDYNTYREAKGMGFSNYNKYLSSTKSANNETIKQIWKAYTTHPGNSGQGVKWVNVKGEMIRQGTVPPSAVNSSAKGRLPAYLACYDYVSVMSGFGDIESDMCLYYIDNPSRGTYAIMWRGKKYMSDLESSMASDGFTS